MANIPSASVIFDDIKPEEQPWEDKPGVDRLSVRADEIEVGDWVDNLGLVSRTTPESIGQLLEFGTSAYIYFPFAHKFNIRRVKR